MSDVVNACEMGFPLDGTKPCAKCGAESNEVCREWVRTAGEQLTTLRAENERLRGQVADLINHANMLRSFLRSGEPMSAQDDDYHQSVIGEARAALQAGEK